MRIGSTIDSFPWYLPLEERESAQFAGIMAQLFVAKISSLFSSKSTKPLDRPFEYFYLTMECMKRVEKMAFSRASSLKFNHTQCRYLARKLSLAAEIARHILLAFIIAGREIDIDSVETFNGQFHQIIIKDQAIVMLDCLNLLHALAMEVEDIIRSCSGDAWTLAAVTLMDVSEHVSSIGFDLELWNVASHGSNTLVDIESIFQAEVEAVKGQASVDKEMLRRDIYALLQKTKLSSAEYERASLLLERLERSRLASTGDLAETPQSSLSEKVIRSMKEMERLGKGAAGTVYRAEWLGAEFAKKTFYGPSFPDFEKEVAILTRLSHPNIASLLCYAKEKRECSIVMELMDGDLFSLMQERLKADEARVSPFGILEGVDIMHQIGEGMRYMHDMKIVHRDLKSLNVLVKCVKALESKVEYVQVKVADFGMSRTKERSMTYSNQSVNVGTTRWMAPELIRCLDFESLVDGEALIVQYPFKCDVYSFGMVCYEILSGDIPFSSISSPSVVKNMVMNGEHPELPSECHELLKNLIERCWSPDASQRPSFGDICVDLRFLKFVLLSTVPCTLWSIRRPCFLSSSEASGSKTSSEKLQDKIRGPLSIKKAMTFNEKGREIYQHLNWPSRFDICLRVAWAFHYLHTGARPRIISKNTKGSNILMDSDLHPKIAAFRSAWSFPDRSHIVTNDIAGTRGYWAPEYATTFKLSEKADVYSYGVLLLEVVSGRKNLDHSLQPHKVYLCDWVRELVNNSNVMEFVDPALSFSKEEDLEVRRIVNTALLCIQLEPERRPAMGAIVATLEGSLNLGDEGMQHLSQGQEPLDLGASEEQPLRKEVHSRVVSSDVTGSSSTIGLTSMGEFQ